MSRNYRELIQIQSFEERFEYLALRGHVGNQTFGHARWLNQNFYTSREWRDLRHRIFLRDRECDLGVAGFEINEPPVIHHIVPITEMDLENGTTLLFDPDNLITTTHQTHNAIHYGDASLLRLLPVERAPGDTKLW